jgi:hypothetical protein
VYPLETSLKLKLAQDESRVPMVGDFSGMGLFQSRVGHGGSHL